MPGPCIFCAIAAGRAPQSAVHADDEVLAFMDIVPFRPGHVLVAPRAHYRRVHELPAAVRARLFELGARIGRAARAALPCDDVHFLINDGPAANQTVPHVHLHVIPRRRGDLWTSVGRLLARPLIALAGPAPRAELDRHAAAIRAALPGQMGVAGAADAAFARGRRVLALLAHPDDEVLIAGLLALCARAGAEVVVVCATRGEAGAFREPAAFAGKDLAAVRAAELRAACDALGAAPPVFLDLPDGAVAVTDDAIARAAAAIAALRPDVAVTLGPDGVYGHRDHIACCRLLSAAAACTNLGQLRILHAAFPRGAFADVYRALARVPGVPLDPAIGAGDLGFATGDAAPAATEVATPGGVDLVLDVSEAREARRAVAAAHRSQLADGDPDSFLRPGLLARLGDTEWYQRASGPPIADPRGGIAAALASVHAHDPVPAPVHAHDPE